MVKRRTAWIAPAVVLIVVVIGFVVATNGMPSPTPNPPGTFSFAALGDAPYYMWEDAQFRLVLRSIEEYDLSWVLHVGDIFSRPCTDALYERAFARLDRRRLPVIYTPGDNEWTECWKPGSGAYAPLDRLARLRQVFFADPGHSLGAEPMPLETQGGSGAYPEFVENARWTHRNIVFATVHMVGERNAGESFPGRTDEDDAAAIRRTEAAAAWVRETFAVARSRGATGVVLAFHADPGFEEPPDDPYRTSYEPFITVLEEETEAFGNPVLIVHGDNHTYVVDHPLVRRTTGKRLENLMRLQVPGSPDVGWVRVVVTPGAVPSFAFEEHVVPRWKYW